MFSNNLDALFYVSEAVNNRVKRSTICVRNPFGEHCKTRPAQTRRFQVTLCATVSPAQCTVFGHPEIDDILSDGIHLRLDAVAQDALGLGFTAEHNAILNALFNGYKDAHDDKQKVCILKIHYNLENAQ